VMTSLYLFVRAIGTKKKRIILFVLSFAFLFVSYLFYHTIRLVAPLIYLSIAIYFWKEIGQNIRKELYWACAAVLVLTLAFSINPQARARISQISVTNDVDVNYEYDRLKLESKEEGLSK